MKALILNKCERVTKTHDLEQLLYQAMPHYPELKPLFTEEYWLRLAEVSSGAVEVRYPGIQTGFFDAERFVQSMRQFRQWFRNALNLE